MSAVCISARLPKYAHAGQGRARGLSAISDQLSAISWGPCPATRPLGSRPTRHTLGGLGYADQVLDVPCRMLAALHRQRPRAMLLLPCDTLSLAYRLYGMVWHTRFRALWDLRYGTLW
jgi:hypothetical protein